MTIDPSSLCIDNLQIGTHYKHLGSLSMADSSKRSLRERRVPKNFGSDNDEQDPYGYAKPSYPRPNTHQDHRNAPQQLTSEARLLVQFLSSLNKRLRQYIGKHEKAQSPDLRQPVSHRDSKAKVSEPIKESSRRHPEPKEVMIEQPKRSRETDHVRAQSISGSLNAGKGGSLLSQCQAINTESANKMLSIENSLKNKQSPSEPIHARLQKIKPNPQQSAVSTPKNTNIPSKNGTKAPLPSQNPTSFTAAKENSREEGAGRRANGSENKIFKRSAYHVAIAYHIYIKKMREKGAQGSEIDPTYSARRLREGLGK